MVRTSEVQPSSLDCVCGSAGAHHHTQNQPKDDGSNYDARTSRPYDDIQGGYFKLKKRSLSQRWLSLELENLTSVGLLVEDQGSKPYRYSVTEAAEAIVERQTCVPGHG
jgi:hypothetical protein